MDLLIYYEKVPSTFYDLTLSETADCRFALRDFVCWNLTEAPQLQNLWYIFLGSSMLDRTALGLILQPSKKLYTTKRCTSKTEAFLNCEIVNSLLFNSHILIVLFSCRITVLPSTIATWSYGASIFHEIANCSRGSGIAFLSVGEIEGMGETQQYKFVRRVE